MFKTLFKYKWHLLGILALIFLEPSINSVLNFWLQRLFNSAQPGTERMEILRLLTAGFLLWMCKRVVSFLSNVLQAHYICKAKRDVKHNMFLNLLGLNTANISQIASSGEYISVFTNDIILLEQRFFQQIISLAACVTSVVILGGSFIALNAKLAVAILVFGIAAMFVPVVFSQQLNEKNLEYSNTASSFTQKLKEYFVAYPTIKNYAIEDTIVNIFDKKNDEFEDTKFEADYSLNLANNVGTLMSWFMQFIAVGLGLVLVSEGEILLGTVISAQSFASDLASPLQNIITNINNIRSVREIVKKLEKLSTGSEMNLAPQEPAAENAQSESASSCDVVFEDLSLELGGKTIIDGFSFRFEGGKKYLIVGLNGSGKSSLFRALKKWFPNCKGRILLDGQDVTGLTNSQLSHTVSYLNENVTMFSGSVRENISLFRQFGGPEFDRAVSSAQIRLDLDRKIIDEGRNVSSGEQRRIEIARSLLESARVLIFDEVVSTLDIETAYDIEKLSLGLTDKTVIFISHNFSGKLIREYDEILVMDSGRLLDHGSYDELMSRCDYFQRICEIKFG